VVFVAEPNKRKRNLVEEEQACNPDLDAICPKCGSQILIPIIPNPKISVKHSKLHMRFTCCFCSKQLSGTLTLKVEKTKKNTKYIYLFKFEGEEENRRFKAIYHKPLKLAAETPQLD
jgi:DNA-directed RNA polymerase subunit RPC12/RpoP